MPAPMAVIRVWISLFCEHLVEAGFLDVDDLAADREDRLGPAVAALLGGAAGGVTFDDVEFATWPDRARSSRRVCRAGRRRSCALLRTVSRALRAASRARAAVRDALDDLLGDRRGSPRRTASALRRRRSRRRRSISVLTSLTLVCDSKRGFGILTLRTQISPSRQSSPESAGSLSLRILLALAYWLMARVSALRNPVEWVPPSAFGMVLAKQSICSL